MEKLEKWLAASVPIAAMMLAAMLALSGPALTQDAPGGGPDVCVSNKGEIKVDKGDSRCLSDPTSHAVAVHDSVAVAQYDSHARAVNQSTAGALEDCTARAHNGEVERCP